MTSTSERILIIESDPDISQIIARQALRPLGYNVTVMTPASAAIEAALADPRPLLERLPVAALALADADIAWLTVQDESTHKFLLRAHVNLPSAWARKLNQPLDDGLSSLVVRSGRPLTIHGQPLERSKVASFGKSAAVLPVKVRNEVPAVLIAVRKIDKEIEGRAQKLHQGIAALAAAVLQSRLLRGLQAASAIAREDSRERARSL